MVCGTVTCLSPECGGRGRVWDAAVVIVGVIEASEERTAVQVGIVVGGRVAKEATSGLLRVVVIIEATAVTEQRRGRGAQVGTSYSSGSCGCVEPVAAVHD